MRLFVLFILFSLFTIAGSGEILGANVSSNVQTEQCLYPKNNISRTCFLPKKQTVANKTFLTQNSVSYNDYRQNLPFIEDKTLSYTFSKNRILQFFKMKLLPHSDEDNDLPLI